MRPQHLVIVNETPVEIMATPPPEFAVVGGITQPNIFEIGKKWRNVHLVLESDAGYDQPIAGDINVYLYHTKGQKAAYFTTLTVTEDMRCDIVLPEHMLGAQYICLSRGEGFPVLVLHKLPDITNPAPDYTLELTVTGDEFDAGGAINVANWNFVDVSGTGLTVKGIVRDSATQVTVTFDPQIEWPQLDIVRFSSHGLPQLALTGPKINDIDPVINVEMSFETFTGQADAENLANWSLVDGAGLVLGAITWSDATHVAIATTGQVAAGTFSVQVLDAAVVGNYDSGIATYDTTLETSTCTNSDYGVDPIYEVTLSDDTFINPDCEVLANWTFGLGASGLTVASVTYVDPTHVTIETTGIAVGTTITVMAELAGLTSGLYNSGVATYDIVADSSTCTDAPRLQEGTLTIQAVAAAFVGGTDDSRIFTLVTDDAALSVSSESAPSGVILAQIMHEGHYGW